MIREFDKETGDIATRGHPFLTGKEATAAAIYCRLRMFFGEYFLNVADGTPWFQSILGKAPQDIAEAALKQRIATAPGVIRIAAFTFDSDTATRTITVDVTILDVNNEFVRAVLSEEII